MAVKSEGGRGEGLFITKPVDALVADTEDSEHQLQRAVGALDLTALGLGAIIGTGIFVIIGEAIGDAGPAIIISFILAGVTCAFSALAFAELASTIPVAGSAYTYSYATMGELVAWIIGWDLILEYGVSVAAVAVGWGQYFNDLLDSLFGISLPESLAGPPGEGGTFNLPAVFAGRHRRALRGDPGERAGEHDHGRHQAARPRAVPGPRRHRVHLRQPDAVRPERRGRRGHRGLRHLLRLHRLRRGLDLGRGDEDPSRDLPIAIVGSLAIATVLYIAVAVVAVGALPFDQLKGAEAPLATALDEGAGFSWASNIISFGALVAITSVVLTILYGQTRIFFAMCRDGLMPRRWAYVHPKTRTPVYITAGFGTLIAIIAAFVPLTEIVKLVNIGTLFAFVLVNIGVIILRRTRPDLKRGFRVPFVPVFPIIGTLLCLYLMRYLDRDTWIRFVGWLLLGLIIYFVYGRRHSRLRRGEVVNPEAHLD
jgi:basic amino acid/polyamine antiporter, APA family